MNRTGIALLLFVAVSVIYAGVREFRSESGAAPTVTEKEQGHRIVAYYFHSTARCMTCQKIETLSFEAIRSGFGEALGQGRLVWRPLNVEEPANAHFVTDYQLSTKSVVLVELVDGVQKRWKNLDRIWEEIGDAEGFRKYIQGEVTEFGGKLL